MKQTPILFSTPMVKALLDGRKTQTRRILKDQPVKAKAHDGFSFLNVPKIGPIWDAKNKCPYGQPGDLLWVRETWYNDAGFGSPIYYYRADGEFDELFVRHKLGQVGPFKWKPSIYMPKAAARIWLRITDVRVERLQDISEDDAEAEGILIDDEGLMCFDYINKTMRHIVPEESYKSLWESINGPESWDANPWVWVVSSEKTEKP